MIVKKIIRRFSKYLFVSYNIYSFIIGLGFGVNLFFCPHLLAGLEDMPIGARSLGMGAAYVALANTADAVFLNPGGLSQIPGIDISLFYQKPYGLTDLSFETVAVTLPLWSHRISLGFSNFGNSLYREQVFILAYSNSYQHKLYYGVSVSYQTIQIESYGSKGAVGADLGFVVSLTNRLKWGFCTRNINRANLGKSEETLPQTFYTGISTQPTSALILNFDIFKDIRFPLEIRFGAEFKPFENLALRAGTANNPSRFSAGFAVWVKLFTVDYAFFTHNDLGMTHQISFSIHFGAQHKKLTEEEFGVREINAESKSQKEDALIVTGEIPAYPAEKININSAHFDALITLPGIGESLAKRIITYRENNGPFNKLEDLLNVPGIGPKTLKKLKGKLFFGQ